MSNDHLYSNGALIDLGLIRALPHIVLATNNTLSKILFKVIDTNMKNQNKLFKDL